MHLGTGTLSGTQQAVMDHQKALRLREALYEQEPTHIDYGYELAWSLNSLAWILATSFDPETRDPEAALRYAIRTTEITDRDRHVFLDTQAAAAAALGDFRTAIAKQEEAIAIASQLSNVGQQLLQTRLEHYQAGEPYFQKPD